MKISTFDLNLFVILNAIYTQGSLTKAADVVGITQPAVSNALSRLRAKFNDDLFLRTGSGMIPTQKTENMIADIQNALMLMQQSVDEPDEFNPSTSITATVFAQHYIETFKNPYRPYDEAVQTSCPSDDALKPGCMEIFGSDKDDSSCGHCDPPIKAGEFVFQLYNLDSDGNLTKLREHFLTR